MSTQYIDNEHKHSVKNYSIAAQSITAETRTYITGSAIAIPEGCRAGSTFEWVFTLTKTGAGTAVSTIDVATGTTGTTTDTAKVSFTKAVGTAHADEARVTVLATVRSVHASTGTIVAELVMYHNLAITGHLENIGTAVMTATSGAIATTGITYIGLCLTTGASDVATIQMAIARQVN